MQSYDYETEHRPANRMQHVDTLSRAFNVLVIEDNPFEWNLSVCQNQDPKIVEILYFESTPGVSKNLIPRFKGPHRIIRKLRSDRYFVADVEGFQNSQRPYQGVWEPANMRPWIMNK